MTALAGRYTLDVPLGDSDLGTVWNAHDEDGTPLVVVTLEDDAPQPLQERFRAHAKALMKITHPSVVHAIAEGEENGAPYLVLERLTGESLASRLEGGPAPTVGRMVEIAVTLSEALAAVHATGIAHGDVEPGNVLLVGEPGKEVPKLIGFGLNRASVRQELGARASMQSLGPVAYAAPEQARGEVTDGPLADQASLAALVYAALSGRPPHIARDIPGLALAIGNDKAPTLTLARRELAPFASTIDKALSPDPKKRFAEIGAFGRALKTAGNMARTVATSPVPLGERTAIGEPPAPALPKAATIPKPSPALGAAKLAPIGPGKPAVVIPRPTRTTQELDIADLKPANAPMAKPSSRQTEELEIADILAATGVQPKVEAAKEPAKAAPAKAAPAKAEPAKAEPAPIAATATKAMFLPPLVPKVDAPPPAPHAEPAPVAPPSAIVAPPPPSSDVSTEIETTELQSIPPDAPRTSDPDVELTSIPPPAPPPPPPHEHAEAKPPPPDHHADPKPSPPPPAAKKEIEKPVVVVDEPSVSLSPSLERIAIAEAAKPAAPPSFPPSPIGPASDPPSQARPAWMVPAAIAAVLVLAIVSWALYRTTRDDTSADDGASGHTLTMPAPPTSVAPPPTTVIAVPPPTEITPPPPTTVAPPPTRLQPPATTHGIAPVTGARPPVTTRPPTTGTRPPTTGTRPPTTGTRPPTTGTRPPPSTTVRRPPPTTTTRPTVVSDPGF